jgi:hypothetical protein
MTIFDFVGLAGVSTYTLAYALLQLQKMQSTDTRYLVLNTFGSIFLLISLYSSFNLPSFLMQTLWLAFTIVGFIRARRGLIDK